MHIASNIKKLKGLNQDLKVLHDKKYQSEENGRKYLEIIVEKWDDTQRLWEIDTI